MPHGPRSQAGAMMPATPPSTGQGYTPGTIPGGYYSSWPPMVVPGGYPGSYMPYPPPSTQAAFPNSPSQENTQRRMSGRAPVNPEPKPGGELS